MPKTIEQLKREGAVESKVGQKRKRREPSLQQVRQARHNYWKWAARRRELQGESTDGYACRFLYEGRI